jgi:hypothetical protein
MYPDRHLEREIRVSLPVIDLPLYQASRSFLDLSIHTIRFQIQYVFRVEPALPMESRLRLIVAMLQKLRDSVHR